MTATDTIPAPPAVPAGLYRNVFIVRLLMTGDVQRFGFDEFDRAVRLHQSVAGSVLVATATFMDDDGDTTERRSRWTGTQWTAWY